MREITYIKAQHEAVDEEMKRDSSVFVLGENIREALGTIGAFAGLVDKYGPERIRDTAISETAI